MSNFLIINAHHPYPKVSEGRLNQSLVELANKQLTAKGHVVKTSNSAADWDIKEELNKHQWADFIILQTPVNWMGVPWTFKKYMDEVYSAGMDGTLSFGDGRSSQNPRDGYGSGGVLTNKKYMLSVTFNAPQSAFNNPDDYFMQGKDVDDMWLPMHLTYRFFGLQALPTFVCYDVMKNPVIEEDLTRFKAHLNTHFSLS